MDNPHKIAEELVKLAQGYSVMSGELIEILNRKAVRWAELKSELDTIAETDKAWERSPDGLTEMALKLKLKSSEKRQSALKTMLRVMENEARGSY